MPSLRFRLYLTCLFLLLPTVSRGDCVISMGYKNGQKPPFIKASPDNTGAYKTIFEQAAADIGCRLKISRTPKRRLHVLLEHGQLDFYPGVSFSTKRASYLYFIANGFMTKQLGLTRTGMANITDYSQLKENNMTWLMEVGSSKIDLAKSYGIEKQTVNKISMEKARRLLIQERCDFYIADREPALYYIYTNQIKSWESIGLQVHEDCCQGEQPMYLGFSRKSSHFSEIQNPDYDKGKPISIDNVPTRIDENCVAYRFGEALQRLQISGKTQQIYTNYFFAEDRQQPSAPIH